MNGLTLQQNFGSFRDPAGNVFENNDTIFRTVTEKGREDYEFFVSSGLSKELQAKKWLIPYRELESSPFPERVCESQQDAGSSSRVWKWLEVEKVPFVSWPCEWCFHQLKDAAVLTLKLQQAALEKGMTLKDASAYNVQMYRGRPIFIDLLSFEKYEEGRPWTAYRQFVMHFLGPLLLMGRRDLRFAALFRDWIDGFPVDFVSKNLPWTSRFSPSCQIHIHWHARLLRKYESTRGEQTAQPDKKLSRNQLKSLIGSLLQMVQDVAAPYPQTEWGNYYEDTNYSDSAFECKRQIVAEICTRLNPQKVVDLGANCGEFSRVLPASIETIISADIDPVAVDKNYVQVRRAKERNIYPVLQDLCNPTPGIGWMNAERSAFLDRAKCDLSFSLALIHHLCIGNNLPMDYAAQMLSRLGDHAVLEFVPKEDSQTQRLLRSREDIFPNYDLPHCLEAFSKYFSRAEQFPVKDSLRTILFFQR